jgi:hypothetical protein
MMLYCDLAIDSTPIWYGVRCLDMTLIKSRVYIPFSGELFFYDEIGGSDPEWSLLGTRYKLAYSTAQGIAQEIPLDAVPSQTINVVLDGQNCSLTFYEKVLL